MTLCKKLTIALLYTSMSPFIGVGMDGFEKETPVQGRRLVDNTQEDLFSREEKAEKEFQAGMEMLKIVPHNALGRLREAEKGDHKGAKEIRRDQTITRLQKSSKSYPK